MIPHSVARLSGNGTVPLLGRGNHAAFAWNDPPTPHNCQFDKPNARQAYACISPTSNSMMISFAACQLSKFESGDRELYQGTRERCHYTRSLYFTHDQKAHVLHSLAALQARESAFNTATRSNSFHFMEMLTSTHAPLLMLGSLNIS